VRRGDQGVESAAQFARSTPLMTGGNNPIGAASARLTGMIFQ